MGIELVKPEFAVGSEKRFFEFIQGLNDKDKVALISHTDLDGISAARVVNEVIDADVLKFVGYEELNDNLIEELKKSKIKKIIFTDLMIKEHLFIKKLEKFADILIIDHHRFDKDFNSDKTVFLNAQDFCAAYLAYYLFSKTQDIEKLDWLVACASIADWMYFKNQEWMKEVFDKYEDNFFIEKSIRKSGKFWDLQWNLTLALVYFKEDLRRVYDSIGVGFGEIGDLEKYSGDVQKEIDSFLKRFEKEKIEIKGGYFWEFKQGFEISSIVSSLLSSKYGDKTIVIGRDDGEYYKFSARRLDKREDMNLLLSSLIRDIKYASAGGHVAASGGHVLLRDKEEFKRRLGVKE